MRLTDKQQSALYHARKRRRVASHSGPIDAGGVFSFLLENGSYSILLEDNNFLIMETGIPLILKEDGSMLLTEDGHAILMER